jgi:protein ImuB
LAAGAQAIQHAVAPASARARGIPSYDDLTPSIPDIARGGACAAAATVLPSPEPVAARAAVAEEVSGRLFAAIHGGPVERLVAIAREFSPRIEQYPGGTVVLDVAGLQRLLGDAAAIAADLAQAGAPRVAVASSQVAAILLARGCAGITLAAGDPEGALRDLPATVLQQLASDLAGTSTPAQSRPVRGRSLPASARAFDVLERWGLSTLGELAALPAPELSARIGQDGLALQRMARGIDARPLVPDPAVRRFVAVFELEWPVETLEPLSFVFARLLEPLAAALERADRGAVAVHVDLRLTNRTSHVRTLPLPVAMRDPRVLRTLLLLNLESHPPAAAVDAVTIELDPAPSRIVQYSLLERAVPSPETLATLMARLGALVGEARCGSPVLIDTHQPDRFLMGPMGTGTCVRGTGTNSLPEAKGACPPSGLRRFRPPVAVRVTVERGRPARVAIDRRGMPGGRVEQAAGPWRTSGGWWEAGRWDRDEWDVALSDGAVCRLFRDRESGLWFLEGVVD